MNSKILYSGIVLLLLVFGGAAFASGLPLGEQYYYDDDYGYGSSSSCCGPAFGLAGIVGAAAIANRK